LPAGPPTDLETTAFLVRGTSQGRRFHFQVSAAAAGGTNPEKNMWEQVPDIDLQDQMRANEDPTWITIILRTIGEMGGQQSLNPDAASSWIDLSNETDEFGRRRAYVQLVTNQTGRQLWFDMDTAALQLAASTPVRRHFLLTLDRSEIVRSLEVNLGRLNGGMAKHPLQAS